MNDQYNLKTDSQKDVKSLFQAAKKRKADAVKYHLLSEALKGNTINVTKNNDLFEALNRERMDFEQILKLHPDEVKETIEYIKERRLEQDGIWWNTNSESKMGEYGAVPPSCYAARPNWYWKDKTLIKNFFNTFSKFRISEKPL